MQKNGGATTQASGNYEKSSHRKIVQSLEPVGFWVKNLKIFGNVTPS